MYGLRIRKASLIFKQLMESSRGGGNNSSTDADAIKVKSG